jgi:glucuronoarabinoxylan endo-1,4-beta-xylanase
MIKKREKVYGGIALTAALLLSFASPSYAASTVTVYKATTYQTIWGFGAGPTIR